jgi:hypothetical protein
MSRGNADFLTEKGFLSEFGVYKGDGHSSDTMPAESGSDVTDSATLDKALPSGKKGSNIKGGDNKPGGRGVTMADDVSLVKEGAEKDIEDSYVADPQNLPGPGDRIKKGYEIYDDMVEKGIVVDQRSFDKYDIDGSFDTITKAADLQLGLTTDDSKWLGGSSFKTLDDALVVCKDGFRSDPPVEKDGFREDLEEKGEPGFPPMRRGKGRVGKGFMDYETGLVKKGFVVEKSWKDRALVAGSAAVPGAIGGSALGAAGAALAGKPGERGAAAKRGALTGALAGGAAGAGVGGVYGEKFLKGGRTLARLGGIRKPDLADTMGALGGGSYSGKRIAAAQKVTDKLSGVAKRSNIALGAGATAAGAAGAAHGAYKTRKEEKGFDSFIEKTPAEWMTGAAKSDLVGRFSPLKKRAGKFVKDTADKVGTYVKENPVKSAAAGVGAAGAAGYGGYRALRNEKSIDDYIAKCSGGMIPKKGKKKGT